MVKRWWDWNIKPFLTQSLTPSDYQVPAHGVLSWVVQSPSLRQPHLRLMSGNFVSKYCINLQDRILSQLSNYIIYRMSWQWSLYSYEPRLDCFADSVLQLHWNESKQYFNACENVSQKMIAQSDGQPCWHWSEQGCVIMSQSSVKCLSSQLCPGRVSGQNPDRPHRMMSYLWLFLIERHSTSVNTSVMLRPRSGCVLFVSEGPPLFWDLSRCKWNQFVILNWNRFRHTKRLCCDFDSKQFTALSSLSLFIASVKVLC